MIWLPDNKDLQEIVEVRYPDLELHAGKLIGIDIQFCYYLVSHNLFIYLL